MVYSMDDNQCDMVCSDKGGSSFRSSNGACVNVLVFKHNQTNKRRDAKQGLLGFVLGDPQFGKIDTYFISVL
jgi:hypothetical protein